LKTYQHVFSPLKIGKITVKNRIESSPAVPFLASADYLVTRELIEWTRALAKGGAAVVTVGDSSITSDDARKHNHLHSLDLGSDRVVNGLATLAETIHRYDSKASIELNLRDPSSPGELTRKQIGVLIAAYGEAATRCAAAGMDMIMVHGGHGHLLSRFFSPLANKRSDRYGGSVAKRKRFAVEVLEEIRARVGDKLAIEYRVSADELIPGAPTLSETIEFARAIESLIDILHVSAGNLHNLRTAAMMIQPLYLPRGINVHYAEEFKKALRIPVTTVGSINMEMAEEILAANKADMVAMIRSLIADPGCVEKARQGEGERIRPCIRCNACLGSPSYPLASRCAVNPVAGREVDFSNPPPPTRMRKVVIAGGGPAGMEAARTAAERGHMVVLFEREKRLGGALLTATGLPFKDDVKNYVEWAARTTLATDRLDVRLSTAATRERIEAERPDVVILAVGAAPFIPPIPGIDKSNVVWAGDVDAGKARVGQTILLAGAGLTGCETAVHLLRLGKEVTIIDALPLQQISADGNLLNVNALHDMLREHGVEIMDRVSLKAVADEGAVLLTSEGRTTNVVCDTVVLSMGVRPMREPTDLFEDLPCDVRLIGDCRALRGNLLMATADGYNAAMNL
jgi:2,4-dienoyl-CoA reductase-like NADH-dependent reductase (Old Yellow Enzyme family)/thioredoxin reductase